jgi:hypothetical protein
MGGFGHIVLMAWIICVVVGESCLSWSGVPVIGISWKFQINHIFQMNLMLVFIENNL